MNWRLALAWGLMWGLAVSAMETFDVPVESMSAPDLVLLLTNFLVGYCVSGVVLAFGVMLMQRRPGLPLKVLAMLGFAGFERLLMNGLRPWLALPQGMEGASILHTFWITMFYASLFVLAWHLSVQAERVRGLLAQAEIARERAEALLGAARYQALQGHVDPAFLLRAMVAMQARYQCDPDGMDRLIDSVVGFLRAAMPGLRSGASTLADEVALAGQYASVCGELDPARTMPAVRVDGPLPRMPFPALMLLPLLDQLAVAAPAPAAQLRVHCSGAQCTLSLHTGAATPHLLSREWLYRFQVGLRTLFGSDWTLALGEARSAPALLLTLAVPQAILFPATTLLEVSHG